MNRIVLILLSWISVLTASISGALSVQVLIDLKLIDRSFSRTESLVKHADEYLRVSTSTANYQLEQNNNRKDGIKIILKISLPVFIISAICLLIIIWQLFAQYKSLPNNSFQTDSAPHRRRE